MEETPREDEEPDLLPFPSFNQADCAEVVQLRLVPKDEPKPGLLDELAAAFAEAAQQYAHIVPEDLTPVPSDQGIQLRAILDQKAEAIREKAAKAEPRAEVLNRKIAEGGEAAVAEEVAAARKKIFDVVAELREIGISVSARVE